MRIKIIVATTKADKSETILGQSAQERIPEVYHGRSEHQMEWVTENKEALAKVYNRAIDRAMGGRQAFTHVLFMHDDIVINCGDFIERIVEGFRRFQVIGLAGNSEVVLTDDEKRPILWHLVCEPRHRLGCVAHGTKDNYTYCSYGPLNKPALMIDGLFMGINLSALNGLRFDEKNPAKFHFYDLIFSMDAAIARLATGIIDVPIIHRSGGLMSIVHEWKVGEIYFKEKYKEYMGARITVAKG